MSAAVELTLTEQGITSQTKFCTDERLWTGISRLDEKPYYLAIYTLGGSVYLIPKRAFAKADDLQEFISVVSGHLPKIPAANIDDHLVGH